MKKRCLVLIVLFLLFLSLNYTYSLFNNTIVGTINANVKDWVFKTSVNNSSIENGGYKLKLSGTSGSFNVNFNTNGSGKDADYTIELTADSSINFYTDSACTNLISNNIYKGNISKNTTGSVTIYYKSNTTINSYVLIKTKGNIRKVAYMKNGYTSASEFWSDTYRPYIRSITLSSDLSNMPSSCTSNNKCWDITESGQEKVYAYLKDSGYKNGSNTLYNLYIASSAHIYAPANCGNIFGNEENLVQVIFNNFDTSRVTTMQGFFWKDTALKSADLSNFNTSSLTNMQGIFDSCSALVSANLSNFNTSNVTNMGYLFSNCSSLTSVNLNGLNTSEVTTVRKMFSGCSSLTSLNLSSFNTTNVTNWSLAFYGCSKLNTTVTVRNASITDYDGVFGEAATASGSKIVVNYTSSNSSLVDSMIGTKAGNSNVVKGSRV